MHGTTMIFLFNTPVLAGFGNYLLPLMIGARDMAFPRLNAFSYWIFLGAGLFISASMVIGKAPDGGWFAYVPLTDKAFSPGINLDFWGLGVIFVGISTTVGAVNFLVTTFKMRAPGMTVNRIPIFVWSYVGDGVHGPVRRPGDHRVAPRCSRPTGCSARSSTSPTAGGSALLYQHLFWFWGHPEVYILFLPAVGMVSTIITTLRPAPAGRLPVARRRAARHRLHQLRRVGAPHVRHRPADHGDGLLLGGQLRDRHPQRASCTSRGSARCGAAGSASPRRCCSPSGSC